MKIISIYYISGKIFQEIEYVSIDDLSEKLKLLLEYYDEDIYITLLINEHILNNFNIINICYISQLTIYDYITIIFSDKKELYCLGNDNGKYILDFKNDNYSKLCNLIILHYDNKSYDIIKKNSYNNLVLIAIKQNDQVYVASIKLQNDKDFILKAVKQNGKCLEFASINLQNDKEVVLQAVKQNGKCLKFASINLQNDEEIILESIKQIKNN